MTTSTVSYSRLSTFLDCQELYRLRYIVKPKNCIEPLQEPLIKGSLAHSCIEEFLKGYDKQVAIEIALVDWVRNVCKLEIQKEKIAPPTIQDVGIYDDWEEDPLEPDTLRAPESSGIDMEMLTEYALQCGHLLHRASGSYFGEDKIRKRDGSVPKNPLEYPTTSWSQAYNQLRLSELRMELDNQAVRGNVSFKRMSFANIAAWGAAYVFNFSLPPEVSKVESIEKPLADQPIYFGPKKNKYWNGFIDTIYSTEDGAVIINDHKTESEKRRPENVAFDLQLNSYAAVIYEQTNQLPDYIAITHLGTNSLIPAHTNAHIMAMSMEYLEEIQGEIDRLEEERGVDKPWMKKWPTKYGSPCIQMRDDVVQRVCPYIRHCWPDYAGCLEQEIQEYLGH